MALAGIWEHWSGKEGVEPITSFSIITTEANPFMRGIHHRMPVIIGPEQFSTWLSATADADQLKSLLIPYLHDDLIKHPVSRMVNSPRNDSQQLIEAVAV